MLLGAFHLITFSPTLRLDRADRVLSSWLAIKIPGKTAQILLGLRSVSAGSRVSSNPAPRYHPAPTVHSRFEPFASRYAFTEMQDATTRERALIGC